MMLDGGIRGMCLHDAKTKTEAKETNAVQKLRRSLCRLLNTLYLEDNLVAEERRTCGAPTQRSNIVGRSEA